MTDRFLQYDVNRSVNEDLFQYTVNQLPVDLLSFALISSMKHRVYGFRVFGGSECSGNCCFNALARETMWRILFEIQQYLLSNRHYSVSPMYIEETMILDKNQKRFEAHFGLIDAVNVVEEYVSQGTVALSPFVIEDVDLQLNGNYIEARFDKTLVKNPHRAILRDQTTYEQFDWQHVAGYPRVEGDNWVMVVGNSMPTDYVNDPDNYKANLQHYDYVISEIDLIDGLDLDNLISCHPNTQQILPFAEKPVIVGDKIRLTWWVWTLGKPEFDDSIYDMVEGEFYKIYDSLDLYEKTEVEQPVVVYIDKSQVGPNCEVSLSDLDQEVTDIGWLKTVYPRQGVLQWAEIKDIDTDPDVTDYRLKFSGLPIGDRYKIKYYYKVNPNTSESLIKTSVESVRRAICAKAAATIDLQACNMVCAPGGPNTNDWIHHMQEEQKNGYIAPTGVQFVRLKFGNRRGDYLFSEILKHVSFKSQGVLV